VVPTFTFPTSHSITSHVTNFRVFLNILYLTRNYVVSKFVLSPL